VTSPLLRAQQTAAGICAQWPALELRECDDLAPGGKPRKLARYLRDGGGNAIGLVGHMPHLGEYTAWLIGSRKAQIDLAKAGVACVECPNGPRKGGGTLVWLVTPEWLS
jgi:phosphohistidine phosphatase SixA